MMEDSDDAVLGTGGALGVDIQEETGGREATWVAGGAMVGTGSGALVGVASGTLVGMGGGHAGGGAQDG